MIVCRVQIMVYHLCTVVSQTVNQRSTIALYDCFQAVLYRVYQKWVICNSGKAQWCVCAHMSVKSSEWCVFVKVSEELRYRRNINDWKSTEYGMKLPVITISDKSFIGKFASSTPLWMKRIVRWTMNTYVIPTDERF